MTPVDRTSVPSRAAGRSQRALLIANPASRRGARLVDEARATFRVFGIRCDAVVTEYPGHAARLAGRLGGDYDLIFALGGDGTAMDVVGALVSSDRPVGILPGGTGNLLARALGIPRNIPSAIQTLLEGEEARIDLGRLDDGRYFAFAAGVGIDASMVESTPIPLKQRLGILAYVLTATRSVLRGDSFDVRATVDGVTYERTAAMVMVTNFGTVLDQLFALGPDISHDDGILDLCVFSPGNVIDAARIAWRLFRKDFRDDPCILYAPGHRFVIETSPTRNAQADGELLGPTPFAVTVEPLGARLLIPRRG